jgi:hypothetical protein
MGCHDVYLDDPSEIVDGWLESTRQRLSNEWVSKTKHRPGASGATWACEIYHGCSSCREHLSLPCSLLAEANEIGGFLQTQCYSDEPATFFRIYLFFLSEFTSQLDDIQKLMELRLKRKPPLISVWANHWAKHRLQILLQHHPSIAFADAYGKYWSVAEERFRNEPFVDDCGNSQPTLIIDANWFSEHKDKKAPAEQAGPGRYIILVPPMMHFLDEAIQYFREFVDACLSDTRRIKRFESEFYRCGC